MKEGWVNKNRIVYAIELEPRQAVEFSGSSSSTERETYCLDQSGGKEERLSEILRVVRLRLCVETE